MSNISKSVSTLEETRTGLCDEFVSVTGSDSAVAQCYLAENDWEMERALNSFFEADMEAVFTVEDSPKKDISPPKVKRQKLDKPQGKMDCIDLTTEEPACSSSSAKSTNSSKSVEPKAKVKTPGSEEQDGGKLSLISWNVDGLDTVNLGERARGLCSYLALYTPDVVFLQELIEPYVQYLKKRAVSYTIIEGGEVGYFTGLMLKKSRVKLLNSDIISYPTTQMMRNLLVAQVTFRDQELCVMTSHFESCKGQAEERMKQLSVVLKRMREAPTNVTVLFGGDTNLRDAEVTKVGGLPGGVCDVWEQLGKQEHCRYTWDTKANSNKSVPYVSRCRFDRVYLRPAKEGPGSRMTPDHMALVGLEKLDCGRYTSDHWGIYCSFIL
ncbi:tyrosyl-DNA phosphodiesterase 2 isoform X1 [Oncorhynchus kisutch]|uniref:Tyrosyl-DNA phosphodiesterase 2 n=1 Tax=Oncorhynchus kisutch TaxID=8019 RepID=A0A8C7D112_ONCKI|nr:tyrosyl-DNA phosphodiesterase 2 isoform X1 [Oncorhynchus kisutch]